MASCGQKRNQPEPEVDPNWNCAVCHEVLLDPVTLPCGHSLDQHCLQKVVDVARRGNGQRACPTCRRAIPAELPDISLLLRDTVQQRYPNQVRGGKPLRRGGGARLVCGWMT